MKPHKKCDAKIEKRGDTAADIYHRVERQGLPFTAAGTQDLDFGPKLSPSNWSQAVRAYADRGLGLDTMGDKEFITDWSARYPELLLRGSGQFDPMHRQILTAGAKTPALLAHETAHALDPALKQWGDVGRRIAEDPIESLLGGKITPGNNEPEIPAMITERVAAINADPRAAAMPTSGGSPEVYNQMETYGPQLGTPAQRQRWQSHEFGYSRAAGRMPSGAMPTRYSPGHQADVIDDFMTEIRSGKMSRGYDAWRRQWGIEAPRPPEYIPGPPSDTDIESRIKTLFPGPKLRAFMSQNSNPRARDLPQGPGFIAKETLRNIGGFGARIPRVPAPITLKNLMPQKSGALQMKQAALGDYLSEFKRRLGSYSGAQAPAIFRNIGGPMTGSLLQAAVLGLLGYGGGRLLTRMFSKRLDPHRTGVATAMAAALLGPAINVPGLWLTKKLRQSISGPSRLNFYNMTPEKLGRPEIQTAYKAGLTPEQLNAAMHRSQLLQIPGYEAPSTPDYPGALETPADVKRFKARQQSDLMDRIRAEAVMPSYPLPEGAWPRAKGWYSWPRGAVKSQSLISKQSAVNWLSALPLKNPVALRSLETDLGLKLPGAFKKTIARHNAGSPVPQTLNTQQGSLLLERLLSANTKDPENILEYRKLLQNRLPTSVVPFATDPYGNVFGLQYASDTKEPKVVFWNHEESAKDKSIVPVADSFEQFMTMIHEPESQPGLKTKVSSFFDLGRKAAQIYDAYGDTGAFGSYSTFLPEDRTRGFGIPAHYTIQQIDSDPYLSPLAKARASMIVQNAAGPQRTGLISWHDVTRAGVGMGLGYAGASLFGRVLDGVYGGLPPAVNKRLKLGGVIAGLLLNTGVIGNDG